MDKMQVGIPCKHPNGTGLKPKIKLYCYYTCYNCSIGMLFNNLSSCYFGISYASVAFNPILTGGGSIWPPPARNPWLRRDRRWCMLASFDTNLRSDHCREVNFLSRTSETQNPHLLIKHINLNVFILSFWPSISYILIDYAVIIFQL